MSITNRGRKWELTNSLWAIWLFAFLLNYIAFFWIGIRAKQRKWVLFGCMYMVLCFAIPALIGIEEIDTSDYDRLIVIVFLFSWLICIIHGFLSREEYLIRRDLILTNKDVTTKAYRQIIQESAQETLSNHSQGYTQSGQLPVVQTTTTWQSRVFDAERASPQACLLTVPPPQAGTQVIPPPQAGTRVIPPPQAGTRAIPPPQVGTQVAPPPQAWAQTAPPPRADTRVDLPSQATATPLQQVSPQKIDLNHCTEQQLVNLPGVGVALAKRAVELRSQIGGFASVEDFCKQLKLQPYFADQTQQLATTTPITAPRQSAKSPGRVIDI